VDKGALVTRALYGGKCAGGYFWHHLRICMNFLRFQSSRAYPDGLMRASVRKDSTTTWYEYVLLYTYDFLMISDRVKAILWNEIGKYFDLKDLL
jgi:hypothetical protein